MTYGKLYIEDTTLETREDRIVSYNNYTGEITSDVDKYTCRHEQPSHQELSWGPVSA